MLFRSGGQPATQPPVLLLIQFNGDGGITAAAADGSQTSHHGVWLRVGDRKFLITTFLFGFNESRALSGITKIRANVQLSADGQTAKGTQEVVVLDREGKAMATIPGGIFTGTRLTPEIPGDFHEFQNMPCDVPSGARTPPAPSTRCVSADARNADRAATQQACEPKFTAVRRQDSSVDEIAAGSRAR